MADVKSKRVFDRTLVSFTEEYEIRYWCNLFGCSRQELRAAVRAVGNDADAVRARLKKK